MGMKTARALLLVLLFAAPVFADEVTPNLGLTKPTAPAGTWGEKINTNFDIIDKSIGSGNASGIPYTPGNATDWDSTPGDVGEALDQGASRIQDLEDGTTPAAKATELDANPTDCTGGAYANTIAANGNLGCEILIVSLADVPAENEDSADGYRIGTRAHVADGSIWEATNVTVGAAVWQKIFPSSGSVPNLTAVMGVGNTYYGADCTADKAFIVGLDANNAWWRCHDASTSLRDIPVVNGIPDGADKTTYVRNGYVAKVENVGTGGIPFSVNAEGTSAILKGLPSGFSIPLNPGRALADTDDWNDVHRIPFDQTVVEICGKTDTGTTTFNLQRNDGSAANILSSNLTATTSEACSTTFTSGEDILSESHYINLVMVTAAASGTPTKLTVGVRTRRH